MIYYVTYEKYFVDISLDTHWTAYTATYLCNIGGHIIK